MPSVWDGADAIADILTRPAGKCARKVRASCVNCRQKDLGINRLVRRKVFSPGLDVEIARAERKQHSFEMAVVVRGCARGRPPDRIGAAVVLLTGAALLAALISALRSSRVDPLTALREE